jgi:hypothetical protein
MGYFHVEIKPCQRSKKAGTVCGDSYSFFRTSEFTVIILVDGIGSGVKANIFANLAAGRLKGLLQKGISLRSAFSSLTKTMHEARGTDAPYSVFTVVQILKNGETTILAYEMPEGIFVGRHSATAFKKREFALGSEVISETNLFLEPGEGILIFSDGISQAGIGGKTTLGWSSEEIANYTTSLMFDGVDHKSLGQAVFDKALDLWGDKKGDDCTLIGAFCREGKVVNILTGPALDRRKDSEVVKNFCANHGYKVVCGATTAQIVARETGKKLCINPNDKSLIAPPGYGIKGIDLVSEGAVTLNQVFNIIDADEQQFEPDSSVTRLCEILAEADRVNFYLGIASNEGHNDIAFKQRGILPRKTIVKLLAERLQTMGKLVEVKPV